MTAPQSACKVMLKKIIFGLACITTSSFSYSADVGFSSSGKDISLDYWSSSEDSKILGWYARVLIDFDTYRNGDMVTVCRDGSISGANGSGTCSGHSGISHSEKAEFDRLGVTLGPTYWISKKVQIHGGVFFGMYSSNINIGKTGAMDYTEVGLDVGISFKPIESRNFKIVLSHETDQSRSSAGIRFSF